jgi:hypothetical protein
MSSSCSLCSSWFHFPFQVSEARADTFQRRNSWRICAKNSVVGRLSDRFQRNPRPRSPKSSFAASSSSCAGTRSSPGGTRPEGAIRVSPRWGFGLSTALRWREPPADIVQPSGLGWARIWTAMDKSGLESAASGPLAPAQVQTSLRLESVREGGTKDEKEEARPPAKPRRRHELSTHAPAVTYASSFSGGVSLAIQTPVLSDSLDQTTPRQTPDNAVCHPWLSPSE